MQLSKKLTMKSTLVSVVLTVILAFCFILPTSAISMRVNAYVGDWNEFTIQGLQTEYEIGQTVTLPTGSAGTTYLVKDPRGNVVTATANQFVASIAGQYQVVYTNEDASTGVIYLNVASKEAKLSFSTNSQYILPQTIPVNTQVTFPNARVVNEKDEDIVENEVATITLRKSNSTTPLILTGEEFKSYNFTEVGKYELVYSAENVGYNKVSKRYSIEVKEAYETEDTITYNLKSSMPTSASQGVEVTLPEVTGKNSKGEVIDVHTSIEVKHVDSNGTATPMNITGFKFVPSLAGNYQIVYTVSDFFGNQTSETYFINDVTDTKAPKIQVVEDYVITQENTVTQELVDAEDLIPTKVALGTTFTIPAIYASDNVVEYKDLTLTRKIKKGNKVVCELDDTTKYPNNKKNEAVEISINATGDGDFEWGAGTYTVVYSASDGTNSTSDSAMSFTIEVVESLNDTVVPLVTVTDFVKDSDGKAIYSVRPGQEFKVANPSVIDYEDSLDASNSNVVDLSPTLKVYAYVTSEGFASKVELELDESGNYFVGTVPADASGTLSIYYESQDDSERLGLYNSTETDHVTKTIEIVNTNSSVLPTFTNNFNELPSKNATQFDTVELVFGDGDEVIVAKDTEDKNLDLSIIVTGPNGEKIDLFDYDKEIVVEGNGSQASATAKFVANKAGEYVVTYVAKNAGGNYAVASTKVIVASNAEPVIVLSDYSSVQEFGKVVIPKAFAYENGVAVPDSWISTIVTGDINKNNEVVVVTYTVTNPVTLKSATTTATFTVKDTIQPKIIFDDETPLYAELVEVTGSNPVKYEAIEIPAWTASDDGMGIDFASLKITVKDGKGNAVQLLDSLENEVSEIVGNSSACKFVPTKDGKYTITFTAKDLAGNSVTETRTIAVGMVTPPTLVINNEKSIPTNGKLENGKYNLSLTINADQVKITDAKGNDLGINDNHFAVTVTGPTGTTISPVSGSTYNYEFTETGTYTIKYTATDDAQNVTTKTFDLVISANDNNGSKVTEILGTVLLIVSILVLAGVVWYFVRPAKKPKTKVTAKKDDDKDNA